MKLFIFCFILFVALAQGAFRFGVYSDSGCTEMVGYLWAPEVYDTTGISAVSCTASSGGQYYDVQLGLAEVSQAERDPTWNYLYVTAQSSADCPDVTDANAQIYAAMPGTCVNWVQPDGNGGTVPVSLLLDGCFDSTMDVVLSVEYDCPDTPFPLEDQTCITGGSPTFTLSAICGISAPVASPVASTAPAAPTAPTAPTAGPQSSTPLLAPVTGPARAPGATSSASVMTPVAVVVAATLFAGFF